MELANLDLSVGQDVEHTVPKRAVTPAEALLLATIHKARKKGHPLSNIKIIGTAQSIAKPSEVQEQDSTSEKDMTLPSGKVIKAGEKIPTGTVLKEPEYRARTPKDEIARLRTIYHKKFVDLLYDKPNSPVPDTFAAAEDLWKEVPNTQAEEGAVGNWTDIPGALPMQKPENLLNKPLQKNGPTLEKYLEQGYQAENYPPLGYAEVPSPALTKYKAEKGKATEVPGNPLK